MGDTLMYFEKTRSMNIAQMMGRVKKMTVVEIKELNQFMESWIKVLEDVAEIEGIDTYIPGHGDIMHKDCFLTQTEYLRNLRKKIVEYYMKRECAIQWRR
jgi:hypothetical protein